MDFKTLQGYDEKFARVTVKQHKTFDGKVIEVLYGAVDDAGQPVYPKSPEEDGCGRWLGIESGDKTTMFVWQHPKSEGGAIEYGTEDKENALEVMENVVKTVKDTDPNAIVVASGYADAHRVGAVSPWDIPKVARDAGADLAMLDTAVKDGHTLFDYLDIDDCKKFTEEAHSYGLKVALAGSVKKGQLKPLYDIGCDVVGVRGAACVGGDRNTGHIDRTAVAELKELVKSFEE